MTEITQAMHEAHDRAVVEAQDQRMPPSKRIEHVFLSMLEAREAAQPEKITTLHMSCPMQDQSNCALFSGGRAESVALALRHSPADEELRRDAERLDWLESKVKESRTFGVSFDYDRYVEDGYVLDSGFRFMRRGYLGQRHKSLRAAIDAEK